MVSAASRVDDSAEPPEKPQLAVAKTTVQAKGEVTRQDSTGVVEKSTSPSGDGPNRADEPGEQPRKHDAKPKGDNETHDATHGEAGD